MQSSANQPLNNVSIHADALKGKNSLELREFREVFENKSKIMPGKNAKKPTINKRLR